MYIIELAIKIYKKIKNRKEKLALSTDAEQKEEEKCEHIFVPIDSTKKVLACSKCGYVVKIDPKKIKKPNPFDDKN